MFLKCFLKLQSIHTGILANVTEGGGFLLVHTATDVLILVQATCVLHGI